MSVLYTDLVRSEAAEDDHLLEVGESLSPGGREGSLVGLSVIIVGLPVIQLAREGPPETLQGGGGRSQVCVKHIFIVVCHTPLQTRSNGLRKKFMAATLSYFL